MEKFFDINVPGHSIKCKLYCKDARNIDNFVIYGHGFGGHRDNTAAAKFAGKMLSKTKKSAVIVFDLPAHGDDVKKIISLDDCNVYINIVIDYLNERYGDPVLNVNATSFGAYLFLKYIKENGNPFSKIVCRCPAINMYNVTMSKIISEDNLIDLKKGRPTNVGFDRKVMLDQKFLDDVRDYDVSRQEFIDFADDILIIHGTKDEIVPFDEVKEFAEENVIEFIPVKNSDHRFQNQDGMNEAIAKTVEFLDLK